MLSFQNPGCFHLDHIIESSGQKEKENTDTVNLSMVLIYLPLRCITSIYLTRQPNLLTSPELKRVCYILSQLGYHRETYGIRVNGNTTSHLVNREY